MTFPDRATAGRHLAASLSNLGGRGDLLVLALPRGGVPVAVEVARGLGAPLDLCFAHKIGAPENPEFAVGSVAETGPPHIEEQVVQSLRVPFSYIREEAAIQQAELARQAAYYRGTRPPAPVEGKWVILVDDGVATGSTALAAIRALRARKAARIVFATPVAASETVQRLAAAADDLTILHAPHGFTAVGEFYDRFRRFPTRRCSSSCAAFPPHETLPARPPLPRHCRDARSFGRAARQPRLGAAGRNLRGRSHHPHRSALRHGPQRPGPSHLPPGARAVVRQSVAGRLKVAQAYLRARGYGLKIWDAFRPFNAQGALWAYSQKAQFVANPETGRALHTWGVAVDATLVDARGHEVPMPSDLDDFTSAGALHYQGSDETVRRDLDLLLHAMGAAGFKGMSSEWWHFVAPDWRDFAVVTPDEARIFTGQQPVASPGPK